MSLVAEGAIYWRFASEVQRLALTPALNQYNRIALQEDTGSFYLSDPSGWLPLGSGGAGGDENIDGGTAFTVYGGSLVVEGGNASGS
jgi:hypothetical protein